MSQGLGSANDRKVALKKMIRALHEGAEPQEAKQQFAAILRDVSASEVARLEEELIEEGMPREEIQRLCDVHLALFRESLEGERPSESPDHPIEVLKKEHELLLQLAAQLKAVAEEAGTASNGNAEARAMAMARIREIVQDMKASENHYVREENVLFPYLEKHGIVQPPAIMWSEHDRIRAIKKTLYEALSPDGANPDDSLNQRLRWAANELADMLASHFYKENNILFPTALKVMTQEEWMSARQQFAEIGYWRVVPSGVAPAPEQAEPRALGAAGDGVVTFETGSIPAGTLEVILNSLPVDITFVDAEDTVRYFSQTRDRVFPRLKAIIGRKVQQCHPEKSIHVVNRILNDFRSRKRDSAEFWIQSGGRFISIRYFALRRADGHYLGCLEVTQDATALRQLQGERRLLEDV